jgi:hypothetical protein
MFCNLFALSPMSLLSVRTKTMGVKRGPLKQDPGERLNLAHEMGDRVKRLIDIAQGFIPHIVPPRYVQLLHTIIPQPPPRTNS